MRKHIGPFRRVPGSLAIAGVLLAAGCGGGGGGGGVDGPAAKLVLGGPASVTKLSAPLGVTGGRGSGSNVFISFILRDKEFNPSDVQVEYGYDVNGDGIISGSETDPSDTDEFFPATPVAGAGDGVRGLTTAGGKGASHLFVWDSSRDLPGARFMTQDYRFTPQGRPLTGSDGLPLFGSTPGLRFRMRANDAVGTPLEANRWGPWTVTKPFDFNNNRQPTILIDPVGLSGVTPNPTGAAADEDVVLNFHVVDPDSTTPATHDPVSVAVDYASVPAFSPVDRDGNGFLDDPFDVSLDDPSSLQWFPASTKAGTGDTGFPTAPGAGIAATWTWDSIADVGTASGPVLLRITPFDSKLERGPTTVMAAPFRLDNYTVFTDVGASLGSARVGHRATTLVNDRVLVTGGRTTAAGAPVATAEIFFPGLGQTTFGAVSPTSPMGTARSHHAQVRLHDGRVLVAGGFGASGAPLSSLEIYDPASGQWTAVASAMSAARARPTAVVLSNGDVLLAGGVDGSGSALASADLFRIATESVVATGAMTAARHSVTGALLPDGRVLIPGGKDSGGAGLSSVEVYTPSAGTFAAGAAMSAARSEHTVSNAVDGTVVVAGGVGVNTIAVFDPAADSWDNGLPAMATSRAGHSGVLLGDGKLLVAGGLEGAAVGGTAVVFDPSTGVHDPANGVMKSARRDAATVVLNNGRVLILGGTDAAGNALSSIEVFTPDGGFNRLPTATLVTPATSISWAFGAVLSYRLVDAEGDPARVLFQYSISNGPWQTCTEQSSTIAGDQSAGTLAMEATTAGSTLPVDPVLKNTVGDHFFIWDTENDLVKADYNSVRVRVFPIGANLGTASTTQPWKVIKNTFVIARIDPFAGTVGGTIDLAYHLQDLDGDPARVVVEYARDLNGDRQILEVNGETWKACSEAPGSDGLGAGYTLTTSPSFSPNTATAGWHHFLWDSIRDLGSPDFNETWSDYFVRILPYDYPAGDPFETTGRAAVMTAAQGLNIVLDPNGLYLLSWGTEGGATYSGTPVGNVKLDETLIFSFNREVDPASVDGTVGYDTLQITVGGRRILGAYQADPANYRTVRFFPQMNDVVNFLPVYNGSENPTVLTRGVGVSIHIPGYVAATSPEAGPFLRVRGWAAGEAAVDVVNLLTRTYSPALTTSTAAGAGAYLARGIAPQAVTSTPANGATGGALNQGFAIEFDRALSTDSITIQNMRVVVDLNGNGIADANDSIVPGSLSVLNTAGPVGVAKSVLIFTPLAGVNLPSTSKILASFAGVTAGDGTIAQGFGGGSPTTSFTTVAGGTSTVGFTESFTNTTNRDASATTALWNHASYPGMLTGLRVGGSGADGTPTPTSTSGNVMTFSSKAIWNFTSLTIPKNEIWRFTGGASNQPVEILVLGNVDIAGVLDVSGNDGLGHYDEQITTATTMPPYGKRYTSIQSSGANGQLGGVGIAGGGAGGTSRQLTNGLSGNPGFGGTAASAGGFGVQANTTYQTGGGGGGHAQAGQPGGQYASGNGTPGAAGTTYGTATFSSGMTAGSGGGAGSSFGSQYSFTEPVTWGSTSTALYYYVHPGASGGGGGGAVKIACNGKLTLRGSGYIDASGGNGGDGYYYYSGGGGGGSGGSVWIICGDTMNLGGIVDVRGGVGGEIKALHSFAQSTTTGVRYGSYGGHGSAGRVRIEAPTVPTVTTQFVAGTAFTTTTSGSLVGGSGTLGTFPGSSSTTINIDSYAKDSNGAMNFSTMNIPAGVTVTLTGTVPAKMRFTGNVTINGVLTANGGTGNNGSSATGSAPNVLPGLAGPGGYDGGIPNPTNTTSFIATGGTGSGPGGGTGGVRANPWTSGSYIYYYHSGSASGGSNLLNFRGTPVGTAVGGIPTTINNLTDKGIPGCYYGAGYGANRIESLAKAGYNDPETLTTSSVVGGSGGGAGCNGGYNLNSGATMYFGSGTSGGGGGGAIAIETTGTFSMGSSGRIDVLGGNAGIYPPTYQYGGAGGGGAGGTVLVRANTVTLSTGAAINAWGGIGGHVYSGYTSYHMGAGGAGQLGAARIDAVSMTSVINTGGILGYSTSTGSLSTGVATGGGDTGTTLWRTAAGLAPDFHSQVINRTGTVNVFLEGAMSDPVTGLRSTTLLGSQNITTSPLTTGLAAPNAVDGYKYWRLVFKLTPPTPELYDVTVQTTTK